MILLMPGVGGMFGASRLGRLADRIGRRTVFVLTVLNTSMAAGLLALTPERNVAYLSV